jgi:hypothetical protein
MHSSPSSVSKPLAPCLMLLLAACVGDPPIAAEDGPITDEGLTEATGAYCDALIRCVGPILTSQVLKDRDTCVSRLKSDLKTRFQAPGTKVTRNGLKQCATAVPSASCEALFDSSVPQCAFAGTLADGAACVFPTQCKSLGCIRTLGAACGTCGPLKNAGALCNDGECEAGLNCAGATGSAQGVCATVGAENASCDPRSPCSSQFACVNGKCTKPLAEASNCMVADGPDKVPCDGRDGLYCRPNALGNPMGTCTKYLLATTGEKCGVSLTPIEFRLCTSQSTCIGATFENPPVLGICRALIPDGAPCMKDVPCIFPAICRDGKCGRADETLCK